jgi:hypothetical protein
MRDEVTRVPEALFRVGLVGALILASPFSLAGQAERTLGVHLGHIQSRQLWSGPFSSERDTGFTFGVNVDVPTPVHHLSVRVELGYARRGSSVWDRAVDPEGENAALVRSHYLSLPIHGKLNLALGPTTVFLFAGPTFELLLETECSQDLCSVLYEERPTVFGLSMGSGISLDAWGRVRTDLEVRVMEGLSNAYQPDFSDVRYRSLEFLIRASFPF